MKSCQAATMACVLGCWWFAGGPHRQSLCAHCQPSQATTMVDAKVCTTSTPTCRHRSGTQSWASGAFGKRRTRKSPHTTRAMCVGPRNNTMRRLSCKHFNATWASATPSLLRRRCTRPQSVALHSTGKLKHAIDRHYDAKHTPPHIPAGWHCQDRCWGCNHAACAAGQKRVSWVELGSWNMFGPCVVLR